MTKKQEANTNITDNNAPDALPLKESITGRTKRNAANKKTETNNIEPDGLLLKGSVTGRSRRNVGANNTELITYKICAGNNFYFVKDWDPKDYLSLGQSVELPIYVKPFQKDGHVMIDYTICGSSFSEQF
jgi:hypothetical protein